jgi:hypothetical protein
MTVVRDHAGRPVWVSQHPLTGQEVRFDETEARYKARDLLVSMQCRWEHFNERSPELAALSEELDQFVEHGRMPSPAVVARLGLENGGFTTYWVDLLRPDSFY